MPVAWTLLKAIFKCLGKNNAFLVFFKTSAMSAVNFFQIAPTTRRKFGIALNVFSKFSNRFAVEPVANAHASYVVFATGFVIYFVILGATYTKATIPVDV